MKRKLYSNMKRMTSLFCVAIVCLTLTSLLLRLTVFSDLAITASASFDESSTALPEEDSGLFPIPSAARSTLTLPNPGFSDPQPKPTVLHDRYIIAGHRRKLLYTGFIKAKQRKAARIQLPEGIYSMWPKLPPLTLKLWNPVAKSETSPCIGQKGKIGSV